MKKVINLTSLLIIFFLLNISSAEAFIKTIVKEKTKIESLKQMESTDLLNLKRKDLEEKIGRKLSFRERVAVRIIKKKLKKLSTEERAKVDIMAFLGLSFSIIGIFFAGIIFGLMGMIFCSRALKNIRKDPQKKTGKVFAIAGIIIGLVAVLGVVIILGFVRP